MIKLLVTLSATASVAVAALAYLFVTTPPGKFPEMVVYEVQGGRPFRQVARALELKGLVTNAFAFRLYAKITGQDRAVKTGEYELNRAMTPGEVMGVIVSGRSRQYALTFPEGANIFEMAQIIEAQGVYRGADFLKLVRDPAFVKARIGTAAPSLEGYLFPETYKFTKFTPLPELVAGMTQNFEATYAALVAALAAKGHATAMPRAELVTLASIVEKETGAGPERPLIASIFANRLKKNMRLQSDPTIIYGQWVKTGAYKANITRADLTEPTEYNTYTVARLPKGPIANPGREALAAVLEPATSDYLYFVSRNNGTHVFSKDYASHLKAVRGYQLDPAAREGHSWRELHAAPAAVH